MKRNNLLETIKQLANEIKDTTIRERRYFHQHPELSFRETETTRKIVEILTEIGLTDIKSGFKGTQAGVVADLQGDLGPGRTVALRADIDALPIREENPRIDYSSVNDGVMHACGHDGHTAALLGAVRVLYQLKDTLAGRIRFIFQPSEELAEDSGAAAMIEEGVLDGVDAIFGLHLWSPYETGIIGYNKGCMTASSDKWTVEITGRGGHASSPDLTVDPIPVACNFVNMLQNIVSREVSSLERVVVTAAKIQAGNAFNVIPDRCVVQGTVRAFEMETRKMVSERITQIAEGICSAMRCKADVDYFFGLPPTVNDAEFSLMAAEVARELFSGDKVKECEASMGAEDMGLYLQRVPGAYFLVGSGNQDKKTHYQHHTSSFNLDEDVLPSAVSLLSSVATKYLTNHSND